MWNFNSFTYFILYSISASGELGLLEMVSEPDIERCASEEAGPQGGWVVRSLVGWRARWPPRRVDREIPTLVGEWNEAFFISRL